MTRKDYIAIAAAFKAQKPADHWDPNKLVQWELDVKAVARVFANDNGRFNRDKFFDAAGGVR